MTDIGHVNLEAIVHIFSVWWLEQARHRERLGYVHDIEELRKKVQMEFFNLHCLFSLQNPVRLWYHVTLPPSLWPQARNLTFCASVSSSLNGNDSNSILPHSNKCVTLKLYYFNINSMGVLQRFNELIHRMYLEPNMAPNKHLCPWIS